MTVGDIINLNRGSKGAAAQACYLFYSKGAATVRVFSGINAQMTFNGILNPFRSLDVAGGADTDFNSMAAGWCKPELRVKSRYPADVRRRDLGNGTDMPKRFFGQIIVALLNGLQYRNNR